MFFNPMNNQINLNAMNQMNQMNQQYQINQMNQMNQQNQINQMYQNPFPNIGENTNLIEINNINQNKIENYISPEGVTYNNKILFQFNKDPKKILNLHDSNNKSYNIYVSIYLNKKELYFAITSILDYDVIALIYKDNIIDYDNSSIDDIEEGGDIDVLYKGELYETYLEKKSLSSERINVRFYGNRGGIVLPPETKISQMIKAILIRFDALKNPESIYFLFNAEKLNINDERKIVNLFTYGQGSIQILESGNAKGKSNISIYSIDIIIYDKNKDILKEFSFGKFLPLSELYERIEHIFNFKINKIYVDKIELNKNSEKSLAPLKVREKIFCSIDSNDIHIHLL